jgi:NTP pyrophosphatase (non-canonical NTP hydrolase)
MKTAKITNGIDEAQQCVADFHTKMNIDFKQDLQPVDDVATASEAYCQLTNYVNILETQSKIAIRCFKLTKDVRLLRMHLLMEELAEASLAMREGDSVRCLDALSDILVVLLGAAVAFDLPLGAGFAEVMRSNFTKQPRTEAPTDSNEEGRLRDKGEAYEAPDLKAVLEAYSKGAK